ncbi:MAG: ATP-binding protein [Candidatus Omnitrophota bacterium]
MILIQDAHAVPDAQRNIRRILDYLQRRCGVTLTAVEGSAGEMDPHFLRNFPDKKVLENVLAGYFERGELTGPTAAAILNEIPGRTIGVEDWPLYEKGYGFSLEALERRNALSARIRSLEDRLQRRKQESYSPELLEADRLIASRENEGADFGEILIALAAYQRPARGSKLEIFLETIEKSLLDNVLLERELLRIARRMREALERQLANSGSGREQLLSELEQKLQALSTSNLEAGPFAAYLRGLAARVRAPVKVSARLDRLANNHETLENLKGTAFFREFESYADAIKEKLFLSEEDRRLNDKSRHLDLLKRLVDLELSFEDWEQLREQSGAINEDSQTSDLFAPHLAFYRNAEERDGVFYRNLVKQMDRSGRRTAAIVTGGFHTDGLVRQFEEAGISYVVLVPVIGSIPQDDRYREQMRGNVSWKNYYHAKNGRVSPYQAFARSVRDALLSDRPDAPSAPYPLKPWRDEIVRELALERKAENAGDYTVFLDELKGEDPARNVLEQNLARLRGVLQALKKLEAGGPFTRDNILHVLSPATMLSAHTGGVLSPEVAVRVRGDFRELPGVDKIGHQIPRTASMLAPSRPEMRNVWERLTVIENAPYRQQLEQIMTLPYLRAMLDQDGFDRMARLYIQTFRQHQSLSAGHEGSIARAVREAVRRMRFSLLREQMLEQMPDRLEDVLAGLNMSERILIHWGLSDRDPLARVSDARSINTSYVDAAAFENFIFRVWDFDANSIHQEVRFALSAASRIYHARRRFGFGRAPEITTFHGWLSPEMVERQGRRYDHALASLERIIQGYLAHASEALRGRLEGQDDRVRELLRLFDAGTISTRLEQALLHSRRELEKARLTDFFEKWPGMTRRLLIELMKILPEGGDTQLGEKYRVWVSWVESRRSGYSMGQPEGVDTLVRFFELLRDHPAFAKVVIRNIHIGDRRDRNGPVITIDLQDLNRQKKYESRPEPYPRMTVQGYQKYFDRVVSEVRSRQDDFGDEMSVIRGRHPELSDEAYQIGQEIERLRTEMGMSMAVLSILLSPVDGVEPFSLSANVMAKILRGSHPKYQAPEIRQRFLDEVRWASGTIRDGIVTLNGEEAAGRKQALNDWLSAEGRRPEDLGISSAYVDLVRQDVLAVPDWLMAKMRPEQRSSVEPIPAAARSEMRDNQLNITRKNLARLGAIVDRLYPKNMFPGTGFAETRFGGRIYAGVANELGSLVQTAQMIFDEFADEEMIDEVQGAPAHITFGFDTAMQVIDELLGHRAGDFTFSPALLVRIEQLDTGGMSSGIASELSRSAGYQSASSKQLLSNRPDLAGQSAVGQERDVLKAELETLLRDHRDWLEQLKAELASAKADLLEVLNEMLGRAEMREETTGPEAHVVVVDDEPMFREAQAGALRSAEGVRSVSAASGMEEALEYLGSHPEVNLLALDFRLANYDHDHEDNGVILLRRAILEKGYRGKVLIMSADDTAVIQALSMHKGQVPDLWQMYLDGQIMLYNKQARLDDESGDLATVIDAFIRGEQISPVLSEAFDIPPAMVKVDPSEIAETPASIAPFRRKHVLIADDKSFVRETFRNTLGDYFDSIETFGTVEAVVGKVQALKAAGVKDDDIVVLSDYEFGTEQGGDENRKDGRDLLNMLRVELGFKGFLFWISGSIISKDEITGYDIDRKDILDEVKTKYGVDYLEKSFSETFSADLLKLLYRRLRNPYDLTQPITEPLPRRPMSKPADISYLNGGVNDYENRLSGGLHSLRESLSSLAQTPQFSEIERLMGDLTKLSSYANVERELSFNQRVHNYKGRLAHAGSYVVPPLKRLVRDACKVAGVEAGSAEEKITQLRLVLAVASNYMLRLLRLSAVYGNMNRPVTFQAFKHSSLEAFLADYGQAVELESHFEEDALKDLELPYGLSFVVSAILENALQQYGVKSREGLRGKISFQMVKDRAEPPRIVIHIRDEAGGIDPEILPFIFRRGYTKGKPGGSGYGLFWALQVVEGFGGAISADNIGAGAQFTITIPLDWRERIPRDQRAFAELQAEVSDILGARGVNEAESAAPKIAEEIREFSSQIAKWTADMEVETDVDIASRDFQEFSQSIRFVRSSISPVIFEKGITGGEIERVLLSLLRIEEPKKPEEVPDALAKAFPPGTVAKVTERNLDKILIRSRENVLRDAEANVQLREQYRRLVRQIAYGAHKLKGAQGIVLWGFDKIPGITAADMAELTNVLKIHSLQKQVEVVDSHTTSLSAYTGFEEDPLLFERAPGWLGTIEALAKAFRMLSARGTEMIRALNQEADGKALEWTKRIRELVEEGDALIAMAHGQKVQAESLIDIAHYPGLDSKIQKIEKIKIEVAPGTRLWLPHFFLDNILLNLYRISFENGHRQYEGNMRVRIFEEGGRTHIETRYPGPMEAGYLDRERPDRKDPLFQSAPIFMDLVEAVDGTVTAVQDGAEAVITVHLPLPPAGDGVRPELRESDADIFTIQLQYVQRILAGISVPEKVKIALAEALVRGEITVSFLEAYVLAYADFIQEPETVVPWVQPMVEQTLAALDEATQSETARFEGSMAAAVEIPDEAEETDMRGWLAAMFGGVADILKLAGRGSEVYAVAKQPVRVDADLKNLVTQAGCNIRSLAVGEVAARALRQHQQARIALLTNGRASGTVQRVWGLGTVATGTTSSLADAMAQKLKLFGIPAVAGLTAADKAAGQTLLNAYEKLMAADGLLKELGAIVGVRHVIDIQSGAINVRPDSIHTALAHLAAVMVASRQTRMAA